MSFTPNFYTSNEGTDYPFLGPSDDFSRPFVDALVVLPPGVSLGDTRLTRWDPSGSFEITSGGTVVIPFGNPVAVTTFGDYVIWESRTETTQATLVFAASAVLPTVVAGAYMFQDRAVSFSAGRELYVSALGQEIAGPGGTLRMASGAHTALAAEVTPGGDTVVTISAEFQETADCADTEVVRNDYLGSINGTRPNGAGNFSLLGSSTYTVDKKPTLPALLITNIAEPCCDCPDYIRFYGSLDTTTLNMEDVAQELIKAQDAYKQLLAYTRFLLQAQIAGGADPADTDRIAPP
jgi:hypothetical protein